MTDIQLTAEQAAALPELAEALKQGPVTVTVKQERWAPKLGVFVLDCDMDIFETENLAAFQGEANAGMARSRLEHAEELARMIRWTALTHAFRCDKAPDYVVPDVASVRAKGSPAFSVTTDIDGRAILEWQSDCRDPGRTYMPRDVAEEFCRLYNLGLIGGLGDDDN